MIQEDDLLNKHTKSTEAAKIEQESFPKIIKDHGVGDQEVKNPSHKKTTPSTKNGVAEPKKTLKKVYEPLKKNYEVDNPPQVVEKAVYCLRDLIKDISRTKVLKHPPKSASVQVKEKKMNHRVKPIKIKRKKDQKADKSISKDEANKSAAFEEPISNLQSPTKSRVKTE